LYDPPSIAPEADLAIDNVPASVHEVECISKIRKLLLPIHGSIHDALTQLNSWRPEWRNHRDDLQVMYNDAERTLLHMRMDYNQEIERLERATQEVQLLQGSLPMDNHGGSGNRSPQTDSQHVTYRRKRIEERELDAQNHSWRVAQLDDEILHQTETVQAIRTDLIPSVKVMERFMSVFKAFSDMDVMLNTEYVQLTARVMTPFQSMPHELWAKIFRYVIQIQEEENNEILTKGKLRASIRCPTRVATGLALVCKRWKNILPHERDRILGDSWVIDLSNPKSTIPCRSSASFPIRLTLATGISPEEQLINIDTRQLSSQLAALNLSHLGVVHFPGSDFNNLLKESATRGNLKSLSIYGEVQTPQFTIPGSVLQRLIRIEIIDCKIKSFFFQVPGNNLRSLRLILNKPTPLANRMSSLTIYSLLLPLKQLEELDLDLGFEDSPQFMAVEYPNVSDFPSRLRMLRTRFTYFRNRLAFLHHSDLRLPELDSITLITIPSFSYKDQWDKMAKIFAETSLAQSVTRLTVESIIQPTQQSRPPCSAASITTYLPNLERMELHGESAAHFLKHLCSTVDPEHPSRLTSLQEVHICDSAIPGDEVVEFVRLYRGELPDTPPLSPGGTQLHLFTTRSPRLRIVETYRCSSVSIGTLNCITEMLLNT
jgi:hypothetical protein